MDMKKVHGYRDAIGDGRAANAEWRPSGGAEW